MSVRDRIASLLVFHLPGTDPQALGAFVDEVRPGGLIFMGDNIGDSPDAVAALAGAVQDPSLPLLLAVDQEGGDVNRLPGDSWPAGEQLHGLDGTVVGNAFAARADLVVRCGLNTNFGIVADVTADPASFIFSRSLGTTPDESSAHVTAAVEAESAASVLSTLKHFPGHGAAPGDSHSSVPHTDMSLDTWRTTDALPFAAGVDAGAPMVMFGHLVYSSVDDVPATMSTRWHEILRDDLGFDGIMISDDMVMLENSGDPAYANRLDNAIRTLDAGMTMLLYVADGQQPVDPGELIDGLEAAVSDGRIAPETIDAAATIVMAQRLALAADA
nr:glycoside hydrolase family 3 N-terminal domain-containing protein [Pseudoclavibacter chungangensis]